jgi:hypothetical protein
MDISDMLRKMIFPVKYSIFTRFAETLVKAMSRLKVNITRVSQGTESALAVPGVFVR